MRILLISLVLVLFSAQARADTAIFAGGNFWTMQAAFDAVPGVTNTVAGHIGERQAVYVVFDPLKIKYAQLLNIFWRNINPIDDGGQFCDRGPQYTTAIYYMDDAQKRMALDSRMLLDADSARMGSDHIATVIEAAKTITPGGFYPADAHNQQYYLKNPLRYRFYTNRCGRDQGLYSIWGR